MRYGESCLNMRIPGTAAVGIDNSYQIVYNSAGRTQRRPPDALTFPQPTAQHTMMHSMWFGVLSLAAVPLSAAEVDFAHDIVPVLKQHCGQCHTGDQQKGGLSLNTRQSVLAGGESGAVIVVGKSGESELVTRIATADETLQMPPEGPRVPPEQVALVKRWIDEGLRWEEGFSFGRRAYEPPLKPRRPDLPPAVDGRENPVDRLLDAYLAQHHLARPLPIDDATFARRVYLDLIGLLPTPDELQAFLGDGGSDKRARLVRALLDRDVDYAEHWLTFWNDLLRNDYTGTGFITGGRKQISKWLYAALVDEHALRPVRPRVDRAADGGECRLRPRHPLARRRQRRPDGRDPVRPERRPVVPGHQPEVRVLPRQLHRPLEARGVLRPGRDLLDTAAGDPPLRQADRQDRRPLRGCSRSSAKSIRQPPQPSGCKQLAALMTHPENGRFTRTIVNRLWHRLMGRGIVHPTDAMQTEPWNADLLDYLAVHLADQPLRPEADPRTDRHVAGLSESGAGCGQGYRRPRLRVRRTARQAADGGTVRGLRLATDRQRPTRFDAPVLRGKPAAGPAPTQPLQGKWLWSRANTVRLAAGRDDGVPQAVGSEGGSHAGRRGDHLRQQLRAVRQRAARAQRRELGNARHGAADAAFEGRPERNRDRGQATAARRRTRPDCSLRRDRSLPRAPARRSPATKPGSGPRPCPTGTAGSRPTPAIGSRPFPSLIPKSGRRG